MFQAIAVRNEAAQHGSSLSRSGFFPQFLSSTFENWQSELLQIVWQAAGLMMFYFWGSSQSRENDERVESKIDALLEGRGIDPSAIDREVQARADGKRP